MKKELEELINKNFVIDGGMGSDGYAVWARDELQEEAITVKDNKVEFNIAYQWYDEKELKDLVKIVEKGIKSITGVSVKFKIISDVLDEGEGFAAELFKTIKVKPDKFAKLLR